MGKYDDKVGRACLVIFAILKSIASFLKAVAKLFYDVTKLAFLGAAYIFGMVIVGWCAWKLGDQLNVWTEIELLYHKYLMWKELQV